MTRNCYDGDGAQQCECLMVLGPAQALFEKKAENWPSQTQTVAAAEEGVR